MKTTMASTMLLVLALALLVMTTAPLTAEAKKKKATAAASGESAADKEAANSFCGTLCEGRKGVDYVVCKESCDLSQRSNLVTYGRIDCKGKCTEQKGITKPAMIVCQEQCEKDYKVKAAEVAAACTVTCAKEKNPTLSEACRNGCTPPP